MSVLSCGILPTSNKYVANNNPSIEQKYRTVFSEPVVDPLAVRAATVGYVPQYADEYPTNSNMVCTNVSFQDTDNPCVWDATVSYSKRGGNTGNSEALPVEGTAYDFRVRAQEYEVVLNKTYDDNNERTKLVVNTAGDKFADPVMGKRYTLRYSWWQLEPQTFSYMGALGEINHVNENDIWLVGNKIDAGTLIVRAVEPTPCVVGGMSRWKTTYSVEVCRKDENWDTEVISQGFRFVNYIQGVHTTHNCLREITRHDLIRAVAAKNQWSENELKAELSKYKPTELINKPVFLDGHGNISVGINNTAPEPTICRFKTCKITPISNITFPTVIGA